ncbi:MAG: tetratricopeptide repeat protein [Proteobacteria bacterium]|nr:tetratricopeptide repeat protein [Pseudomonadota bacterium]MDA1356752.1 tetratricopeptide repeat protein [Pseudomonadota bacterium]
MKARRWAMAASVAVLLTPAIGWAQSDTLLDNYNQYATFFGQGKFQEALPFALEIIALHKKEFGVDHPTAAVLRANVGELYVEMGRLELAEPLFVEAVQIAERSLGQGHRTTAVLVGRLAKFYRQQNRYDLAETLYMRTILIKEREFGPNHMAVAVSLNDLAQLYYLEGRFAEAEPLYRRALSILAEIERVHPLTSAVLFNNVAELFSAQGRSVGAVMPRLAARIDAEEAAAEESETTKVEQIADTETTPEVREEVIVEATAEVSPESPEEIIVVVAAAAVATDGAPELSKKAVATRAEEKPQAPLNDSVVAQAAEISPKPLNSVGDAEADLKMAPDAPPDGPRVVDRREVVVAATLPRKIIDIRAAKREPVEITVEDSAAEIVVVRPAETPPQNPTAEPEEIVIVTAAAETETPREPVEAVVAEIVEPVLEEQAESLKQIEIAPEQPIAETVVVALEPELVPVPEPEPELVPAPEREPVPVVEEIPVQPADLRVEKAATESASLSNAEVEWARIDAVLDVSRENQASDAPAGEDAAEMHFDLAGVIIDGSSIYSTSELLPSYRRFLGQDVSVNDLYKISQAITARYQADGYGETSAVVPAQLIRSGVVIIRIEEGFVGNAILVN